MDILYTIGDSFVFRGPQYTTWSKLLANKLNYIDAKSKEVYYIGRKPAASPATGYLKKHLAQQKEIIEKVLR